MRAAPFLWRAAFVACSCAAFVLIPLSLVLTWLARCATRGQEHAEIQLLYTAARRRAHPRTAR